MQGIQDVHRVDGNVLQIIDSRHTFMMVPDVPLRSAYEQEIEEKV